MADALLDLHGRRALITGASAGLGAHFAATLAKAGAGLILCARRAGTLEGIAAPLRSGGTDVKTLHLDVQDAASVTAVIAQAGPFHILVNNAGIVREAPALQQYEADWDTVMDTNLKGAFLMAQSAAISMHEAGIQGSIINIASILGLRETGGVLPYSVSKAGLIHMTKLLAFEFARYHIRVNALAPGYLETELNRAFFATPSGKALIKRIPQRRLGQLSELDGPLLLLASDASRYMTGSIITVDGGHMVSSL